MRLEARGTFTVSLTPLGEDKATGSTLGRSALDKVFEGDLVGTSTGQMLTAITDVKGSAGYVAIERVSGTLHGRRGSFVLQHNGVMTRGAKALSIVVVPDSGTEELAGISGSMTVEITEGRHSYRLEYSLPDAHDGPGS